MLSTLVSHNPDIKKLVDKGYAVSFDSDHLVIRDIPYLDRDKNLKWGAIVSTVIFIDNDHVQISDHQILFCGSHPCEMNGTEIRNLGGGPTTIPLVSKDLVVERSFSNKPPEGFGSLFDKVESYVRIICGPAMTLFPGSTPLTFRIVDDVSKSVFKFRDTLTTRAELGELAAKFSEETVAIIGLGGTGAYLLDLLVKTPVKEIRGFDLDPYHIHNAFRSPGKLVKEELGKSKAEVYQSRYENFRHGLRIFPNYILADSDAEFEGVTFAFVCVDKGASRAGIFELLVKLRIPFIDVGMGLDRERGAISGTIRTTYYPPECAPDLIGRKLAPMTDIPDDVYRNNIQISELNALNACMAVIRYKQIKGFYASDESFYHLLFTLDNFHLAGE